MEARMLTCQAGLEHWRCRSENVYAPAHLLVAISLAHRAGDSPGQRDDRQQHWPARHGGLPYCGIGAWPTAGLAEHSDVFRARGKYCTGALALRRAAGIAQRNISTTGTP